MSWFADWFDSPYYHRLYQHRDDSEAALFIERLLEHLKLPAGARLLDMACGRGRHSVELARRGYRVVGMDLSPESIAFARKEHVPLYPAALSFSVHDMRLPFVQTLGSFDAVLNLFTSFGYFETEDEHRQTLRQMADALARPDGVLVLDFFNARRVLRDLAQSESKTVSGLEFNLERSVINGYIIKDIRFEDAGRNYHFQERVRAFTLADFDALFASAGLERRAVFGSYALDAFDPERSERLIVLGGLPRP